MEEETQHILLIENDARSIQKVASILMPDGFALSFAMNTDDGLTQLEQQAFDLLIMDSSFEKALDVVAALRSNPKHAQLAILFAINPSYDSDIAAWLEAGVTDTMHKPFIELELRKRVTQALKLSQHAQPLDKKIAQTLKRHVDVRLDYIIEQNEHIGVSQQEIINTLCSLIEKRSQEKTSHVRQVAEFSYLLALLVGFNDKEATLLKMAAPMHDIGNLAISDTILSKPDRLSMVEFEQIELHTTLGYEMLKTNADPVLKLAAVLAWQHHEKYNGSGYPLGLKADEIHMFSRIVALADVFNTLSNDRGYDKAWSNSEIEAYIRQERAQHFDPTLVDLFFKHKERFFALRDKEISL